MEGARYPSGDLKARPPKDVPPNPTVVDLRRALMGQSEAPVGALTPAENPFDLIRARGWITEEQHRAGQDYAALCKRAGLCTPTLRTFDPDRTRGHDNSEGDEPHRVKAMATLRTIWERIGPKASEEMNALCVHGYWRNWIIYQVNNPGEPLCMEFRRAKRMLERGLMFTAIQTGRRIPAKSDPTGQRCLGEINAEEAA
jgi:hypothetical protein